MSLFKKIRLICFIWLMPIFVAFLLYATIFGKLMPILDNHVGLALVGIGIIESMLTVALVYLIKRGR